MTTEEINNKLDELRKKYPAALAEDRRILRARARALQIILERRKKYGV